MAFQSSSFLDFVKNVVGNQGNAPGWPNQYKRDYPGKYPGPETIPDRVTIFTEPPAHIPREPKESNPAHNYGANLMVADVPFDMTTFQKSNNNLAAAGWVTMLIGMAFYIFI